MDFDRWDTEQGDNFRGRYETYLTDPKIEPRKSKWKIEVAIKNNFGFGGTNGTLVFKRLR